MPWPFLPPAANPPSGKRMRSREHKRNEAGQRWKQYEYKEGVWYRRQLSGGVGRRWALPEDERGEEAGTSPSAIASERLLAPSSSLPLLRASSHVQPSVSPGCPCPEVTPNPLSEGATIWHKHPAVPLPSQPWCRRLGRYHRWC